jgi:hypothetical protein
VLIALLRRSSELPDTLVSDDQRVGIADELFQKLDLRVAELVKSWLIFSLLPFAPRKFAPLSLLSRSERRHSSRRHRYFQQAVKTFELLKNAGKSNESLDDFRYARPRIVAFSGNCPYRSLFFLH